MRLKRCTSQLRQLPEKDADPPDGPQRLQDPLIKEYTLYGLLKGVFYRDL